MEAAERGEKIESTRHKYDNWCPTDTPAWAWNLYDYRVAQKPEKKPVMPDAPVWWIREIGGEAAFLVCTIKGQYIWTKSDAFEGASLDYLEKYYHWSADRKTWYNFYGEEVI